MQVKEQQANRRAVLDWLLSEFGVEKATQKLADLAAIDDAGFLNEVKKARGKAKPLSVRDIQRLKQEYFTSVTPLHTLAAEALRHEQAVSDQINAA